MVIKWNVNKISTTISIIETSYFNPGNTPYEASPASG